MTEIAQTVHGVAAGEADAGARLDRFLSERLSTLLDVISRSRTKALIKQGSVRRAGETIEEPNYRVKPGDVFDVLIPAAEPAVPQGEPLPLDVVFEDDAIIVISKPAGLVVHPAAGNWTGTLVNALISHCGDSLSGIGGVRRPGIVHRLDKATSGLMVVAKTDIAHQSLTQQFAAHGRDGRMERAYLAVVWGVPMRCAGKVDAAIDRKATNRMKMAVVAEGGRHAVTHYRVERTYCDAGGRDVASLLRCTLETGRTHQIRVHMAHIGHPLLGDQTYGAGYSASISRLPDSAARALKKLSRQALHATSLGFEHPLTQERQLFERSPPDDLAALIAGLSEMEQS